MKIKRVMPNRLSLLLLITIRLLIAVGLAYIERLQYTNREITEYLR